MAGPTAATAELLPLETTDAYSMGGDAEVWYRLQPTVTGSYLFILNGATSSDLPYADIYRITGSDPPAEPPWGGLDLSRRWVGYNGIQNNQKYIEMVAGSVYLVACYMVGGASVGDASLRVNFIGGPANDRVISATVLGTGETIIAGTTIGATEEYEEANYWGNQVPSVWYKVVIGGPGDFRYGIRSLTSGFKPYIRLFHAAGAVSNFDSLNDDISAEQVGNGTENPPARVYDQIGTPGTTAGDLAPLVGGEIFYLYVSSYDTFSNAQPVGNFELTVFAAPIAVCLNAADYLGSSPTASVVSGSVRESQRIDGVHGTSTKAPFEGFIGDGQPTLTIPGAAIASSPSFYAVSIKTKNSNTTAWCCGMKRNGQPLWPGASLVSGLTTTPVRDSLTMLPGSLHPNELDMVRYLPVKPGDTIDVIMELNQYNQTRTIDITEICFQRILSATDGPAYALLDIPDYPLGLVESELGTNAQQGDLIVGKDTAPTFTEHRIYGMDMCVTNDGVIWALHLQHNSISFSGTETGPVLSKWNPSSPGWTTVNDDIEGLGVKHAQNSSSFWAPYNVSIDTDGTNIWVCYSVDDGPNGFGGGRKIAVKVRKYNVSGASWSTVGSPFHGINSGVGPLVAGEYTSQGAGGFDDTPQIRVSPAGVPWVGFVDYEAAIGYESQWPNYARMPYVARWTGSTWDVKRLPMRSEFTEPTITVFQAKDYRVSSGTTSEQTYLSETCVKETQTVYTNDTCSFVPPAGKWVFKPRIAKDYISGAVCGLKFKWYKNGSPLGAATNDGATGDNITDIPWTRYGPGNLLYTNCNGTTDTISIRIAKTGSGTEDIYIDELILIPANVYAQGTGFGIDAAFVRDGQPHVGLFMHKVGETGLGENPGALYQTSFTVPQLDNPTGDGYWAPDTLITSWNYQTWVYSEWNGTAWVRKWQRMIEEDAPDHVYVVTRTDSISSTPPLGHFQQGFGFCTDGIDNYMTANCGGGQAFGFFGDAIVALKIGLTGFVPFTDRSPAHLQGPGYPRGLVLGLSGFSGWGWDTGARSIHVDTNGRVWLAWNGIGGATGNYTNFVATAAPNGLGGWFAAGEKNEDGGYDNTDVTTAVVVSSPDGSKVYVLKDDFIWDNGTTPSESATFAVWMCNVIPNAKIPLIPLISGAIDFARIKFRGFQLGDV